MKSITQKTFCAFMLLVAGISATLAQSANPGSKVSGSLTDDKGKPVDYATISILKAQDSSVVKGTLSNEAGVYIFDHISPGTYIIMATVVGYNKAASKPFAVSDSLANVNVPAIVMQQGSHALNEVTISATKPLIERKIDRMVMNVENSPLAAGNSAMEILERAPGVTVDKDDNISLKGKQGVTVMINDKLTYLSSAQLATLLRSTDGTTIQSIELITNPSAKYDAAGNSGIINIKLKKNKQSGTNGSITLGAGYGTYGKDNGTVALNHKEGNVNVFGSFSHNDNERFQRLNITRIVTDSLNNKTYLGQQSFMATSSHINSYRIGADYETGVKNTLGFLVNGYSNIYTNRITDNTFIGTQPNVTDSYQNTNSLINLTFKNLSINLNDKLKIDSNGQELGFDLDYSKFNNNSNANYVTDFFNPDGSSMAGPALLRNQTPSVITIHAAKADYAVPLSKTLKFETGVKFSDVKTDNNLQAQQQVNGTFVNDTTLTNRFIYTEKIDAAYINLNKTYKNTTLQAGLRGEYTLSSGNLVTNNEVITRHYFNLFPSVFINHTINDKNEVGFSYSRRIDRPGYDNLNPFVYYLDQYTYSEGNPFLRPQYTNKFEFNYTWDKTLNVSFGYSHTSDAITSVDLTDITTKASIQTTLNLQQNNDYDITVNSPFTIIKWWTGNANATLFYQQTKADSLFSGYLNRSKFAYNAQLSQIFAIAKGYRVELMSRYSSSSYYGIFLVKPQYSTDIGLSHSFAEKRANIKFAVSDIFNQRRNELISTYQPDNIDIKQKNETRVARITFTYNFGNSKIKARQHQSGTDDLKNRVTGAN